MPQTAGQMGQGYGDMASQQVTRRSVGELLVRAQMTCARQYTLELTDFEEVKPQGLA